MPTFPHLEAAVGALVTAVSTSFAADADIAAMGGCNVLQIENQPNESDQLGKPYVLFEAAGDERDTRWTLYGRRATVKVKSAASEMAGGRVGAANPLGAHTLLSQKLQALVTNQGAALFNLGLMRTTVKRGAQGQTQDAANSVAVFWVQHEITFRYLPGA